MAALTPFEAALQIALDHASGFGVEEIGITKACGRVLASPIVARQHSPRFDNSAVDGYAISETDRLRLVESGSVTLKLAGRIPAGAAVSDEVRQGHASRVYTGSKLPIGTSAVIMQEDVALSERTVMLSGDAEPAQHIRRRGEEYKKGDMLVEKCVKLNPASISLAASEGLAELVVHRAPRVAVLATGTELADLGEDIGEAGLFESNSYGIHAALQEFEGLQFQRLRVRDDLDSIIQGLAKLLEQADIVLTTGGASVGDFDFIGQAFERLEIAFAFKGVAMKPGKPVGLGFWDGKPVFALPGNPLSALVCTTVLVAPLVRASLGLNPLPELDRAVVTESLFKKPGRTEFVPAVLREGMATPTRRRASNMLSGFAEANALLVFPAASDELREGSLAEALPLPWAG